MLQYLKQFGVLLAAVAAFFVMAACVKLVFGVPSEAARLSVATGFILLFVAWWILKYLDGPGESSRNEFQRKIALNLNSQCDELDGAIEAQSAIIDSLRARVEKLERAQASTGTITSISIEREKR